MGKALAIFALLFVTVGAFLAMAFIGFHNTETDREHWAHAESGNLQVRTYDPTETLINPSEIDQTAMTQAALREMLQGN